MQSNSSLSGSTSDGFNAASAARSASRLQAARRWLSVTGKFAAAAVSGALCQITKCSPPAAKDGASEDGAEDGPKFDQALWDEELSRCSAALSAYRAAMADTLSDVYIGIDCFGHRRGFITMPKILVGAGLSCRWQVRLNSSSMRKP